MIKDFLQHNDIATITKMAKVSRTYVIKVLESIETEEDLEGLTDLTEKKREIINAIHKLINDRLTREENAWKKQQQAQRVRISKLKKCAKALAR